MGASVRGRFTGPDALAPTLRVGRLGGHVQVPKARKPFRADGTKSVLSRM